MPGEVGALARAVSDSEDRLTLADEPLASLQLQCGGDLPGTIAVPALLEAVRKARRYQMKLARTIAAQSEEEQISAWIEVEPREDGESGCDIRLRNWSATPLRSEDSEANARLREELDRHACGLTALLDPAQRLRMVESTAPDLAEIAEAMEAQTGRPWTDFVEIPGTSHRQPLHWRLLDGAKVRVPGSERDWRAVLLPQGLRGGEPAGFELLLVAEQALPLPERDTGPDKGSGPFGQGLIGREVAPALRQPIARIIANAETIRTRLAGPLPDDYAGYAAEIATAGQHLLGLLDDLSDLEVVEADDFSTIEEIIDLADVARKAAGILGVRAKERHIAIDLPKSGECLPAVGEFRRVMQILLNLLGNAIRYGPEGSQIWFRLEESEQTARVVVADQGPGLSDEQQASVFEKFERLGRSGDGGTGLGLYISRRLARAMNGELSVESAPGQGARFILDLPRPR